MVDELYCGMLMFADDMAMMAESEEQMARMLDRADKYSKKWKFRKEEQDHGGSRKIKKGETKVVAGKPMVSQTIAPRSVSITPFTLPIQPTLCLTSSAIPTFFSRCTFPFSFASTHTPKYLYSVVSPISFSPRG